MRDHDHLAGSEEQRAEAGAEESVPEEPPGAALEPQQPPQAPPGPFAPQVSRFSSVLFVTSVSPLVPIESLILACFNVPPEPLRRHVSTKRTGSCVHVSPPTPYPQHQRASTRDVA